MEHLGSETTKSKVSSFVYESFWGKDSPFLYGLVYLMIRNSELLREGDVYMLGKELRLRLTENKPKDYSVNTILFAQI